MAPRGPDFERGPSRDRLPRSIRPVTGSPPSSVARSLRLRHVQRIRSLDPAQRREGPVQIRYNPRGDAGREVADRDKGDHILGSERHDGWLRLLGRETSRRRAVTASAGAALVGAFGGITPRRASAQEATPSSATCPVTSLEENKALIERYWAEVWTAGGEIAIAEILAPDEVHHWGVGGDTVGPDAFMERLEVFLTAFPDFAVEVDLLVAEDDLVVSYWTATATHEGEWLGIAPSGTSVEYTGVNFFRIACGQIVESWGEADHLGLLRQLGALPEVATPIAGTPTA